MGSHQTPIENGHARALRVGEVGGLHPARAPGSRQQGGPGLMYNRAEIWASQCPQTAAAMTYCLAIAINEGLVFSSDSRTNAGADQVRTYSKMRVFGVPGDRQFVLLSAGNLATCQGVVAQLERAISDALPRSLLSVRNMSEAADYLGAISIGNRPSTPAAAYPTRPASSSAGRSAANRRS